MAVYSIFSKWLCLVFVFINIALSHYDPSSFNFDQMKNDLFLSIKSNISNRASSFKYQKSEENEVLCWIEMNALKNGLENKELWAMKSKLVP